MYYFIVNPIAGGGKGAKTWQKVKGELEKLSVSYMDYQLQYKGEARRIAANLSALREPFTAVIVGGDGTINEFLGGLTESVFPFLTLGCIPVGSANDFVLGLGLKRNTEEALLAILHPKEIRRIKVGAVTEPLGSHAYRFAVSAGIGFDADVCNGSYKSKVKDFLNFFHAGRLIYLYTALKLLVHMKQHRMVITLENGAELRFGRVFFTSAMNLPYEGGGFMFAPKADPESDSFQLVIAEGLTRTRVLRLLPLALSGRHVGKAGIHIYDSKKFTVRAAEKLCVHTDGEIPGFFREVTFQVLTPRLAVIVS